MWWFDTCIYYEVIEIQFWIECINYRDRGRMNQEHVEGLLQEKAALIGKSKDDFSGHRKTEKPYQGHETWEWTLRADCSGK